jgi:glycosyltransferase involved in cell wall biosynthesis
MVYPLIRRLLRDQVLEEAHWVALNPKGPRTATWGGLTLHNVALDAERAAGYGRVKEAIWGRIHEIDPVEQHDELFWSEAFSDYAYYNRQTSELIQKLDARFDFDVFYIHDFQQLPVGHMLGTLKPRVFRWHIPFDAGVIPEKWQGVLGTYLSAYDVIVVSAERYAKGVQALQPRARIHKLYPYVDPDDYSMPDDQAVARVAERFGLGSADTVALLVGRMDPIKGQDRAIEAVAALAAAHPTLKLVLVGNGSFSGSGTGLGMTKSGKWRAHLEELVRRHGLAGRVVFTGHVGQSELDCLYERCAFTILPSIREGFGLVAVESWLHNRPAIITDRAGISELVKDGVQALLFDPEAPGELEARIRRLLDDPKGRLRAKLIRYGRDAAKKCSMDAAERGERTMLADVMEAKWLAPP